MSIFSGTFACFVLLLGIIYFIVPKKGQWIVLLAGNLVFYAWSGPRYLIYILSCGFFTWLAALQIEKINTGLHQKLPEISRKEEKAALRKAAGKQKRIWLTSALILTLGVWIVLKYGQFILDIFNPDGVGFVCVGYQIGSQGYKSSGDFAPIVSVHRLPLHC